MKRLFYLSLLLLSQFSMINAQDLVNTLELSPDETSPAATLDEVSWIHGYWKGEAMGGQTEEIWSRPMGGSMMGSFKLVYQDEIHFYEIMTISEIDQTLIMRLKHFHADLKGWEEKDETVDFKLVKITQDKVFFDGLTFEKISEKEINVYVIFEDEGKRNEGKFNYVRVRP